MLTFKLSDVENGTALCGLCHTNYDCGHDPGLVIVLDDLEFFIRYEEDDYIRRCDQAKAGVTLARSCPSVDEYRDYLPFGFARTSQVTASTCQG
jgi:hypothetical protein